MVFNFLCPPQLVNKEQAILKGPLDRTHKCDYPLCPLSLRFMRTLHYPFPWFYGSCQWTQQRDQDYSFIVLAFP